MTIKVRNHTSSGIESSQSLINICDLVLMTRSVMTKRIGWNCSMECKAAACDYGRAYV